MIVPEIDGCQVFFVCPLSRLAICVVDVRETQKGKVNSGPHQLEQIYDMNWNAFINYANSIRAYLSGCAV
jgi:hypothetical protein